MDLTVPIEMKKGSIAMWNGVTWYARGDRMSSGDRIILHRTYSRMSLCTYDHYRDIDQAILDRNPPKLTTLAGLEDLFEKNS